MSKKSWIFLIPFLILGAVSVLARPAAAGSPPVGPQPQVVYQTPTANPDGRVVYIVQPGDTCLRIQILTNNDTTIEELQLLNKLDQGCTLREGQELLLKVVTPEPTVTPNPLVTPTPLLPTPTPFNGNGKICVWLFNDVNGNAIREEAEVAMIGGAVSITDQRNQVSRTGNTTDGIDPFCEEVPEGEYNISMAIPGGYNATTTLNLQNVKVPAGDQAILEFGAQASSVVESVAVQNPVQGDNNMLLAILGGLLVVLGIGLGVYIAFARRG